MMLKWIRNYMDCVYIRIYVDMESPWTGTIRHVFTDKIEPYTVLYICCSGRPTAEHGDGDEGSWRT